MKRWNTIRLLTAAAFVGGMSCQRLLQDIPTVGIGSLAPIGSTTTSASSRPSVSRDPSTSGTDVEAELVRALEIDPQVTVITPVELGELLCDTLSSADDAFALSFAIHENETVTAEQLSYTTTDGNAFTDGVGRKVWTGVVVDPVQAEDEAVPRTVSMTWGDVCDTETFLLKVTKRNIDETTTIVKTVPCDDSATYTCIIETLVEFEEPGDALIPNGARRLGIASSGGNPVDSTTVANKGGNRGLGDAKPMASSSPNVRRLQGANDTVINVMILYSEQSMTSLGGITPDQMETTIWESLVWTNQAFVNSEVSMHFIAVHIGPLPYEEESPDGIETLSSLRTNKDVAALRDSTGADLVQMVGYFTDGFCGWGYTYFSAAYGFSLVRATCLDNYVHTHEFGHNLGCLHNRESTDVESDYAHGLRYCGGLDPYRTIMSYTCGGSYGNYFSNPNVTYLDKPTGTATEDNARAIRDNMVAVSNFRIDPTTPPPSPIPSTAPPTSTPSSTVLPTPMPSASKSTSTPPTTYSYIGCYGDSVLDRVLSGEFMKGYKAMTTEVCAVFCEGAPYFGTEYGLECFCGAASDDPAELGDTTCTFECAGDASEICGGPDALSVYKSSSNAVGAVAIPPQYMGCWGDTKRGRIMDVVQSDSSMTNDHCDSFCAGSSFYGLQNGRECWCGDASTDYTAHGESSSCDMACAGDAETLCGGYYSMAVWEYPTVDT